MCVLKLSRCSNTRSVKDITNKSFIEWVIDNRFFICCIIWCCCCCCFIHAFGLLNLRIEWVWATFGAQISRIDLSDSILFRSLVATDFGTRKHGTMGHVVVPVCASIFILNAISPANWLWLSFVLVLAGHFCNNVRCREIGVPMLCVVDSLCCWCMSVFNCGQNRYLCEEKETSSNTSTNSFESIYVCSFGRQFVMGCLTL